MSFSTLQSGGSSIAVKDEGLTIAAVASSIDFTGAGVSGSAIGGDVTENISGAAGGSLATETPSGTVDGSNTSFSFSNQPTYIIADNQTYFVNKGYTISGAGPYTVTMDAAPWSFIRGVR